MVAEIVTKLSPKDLVLLSIIGLFVATGGLVWVVGMITDTWRRLGVAQLDTALKQQMLDRGFSVEEIARVIEARRANESTAPCACEAVVEQDGEWVTALILARAEGQYFVHFVGSEMSDNEWVPSDRVRMPVRPEPAPEAEADRRPVKVVEHEI